MKAYSGSTIKTKSGTSMRDKRVAALVKVNKRPDDRRTTSNSQLPLNFGESFDSECQIVL
jgi:hypothetical protein